MIAQLSKGILAVLGIKEKSHTDDISSEELKMVVNDAKPIIASNYQKMLLNIIDLVKVKVEDIMIPRHELIIMDNRKMYVIIKQKPIPSVFFAFENALIDVLKKCLLAQNTVCESTPRHSQH
jgi:Mg2+/Co2+ transporter CorB